MGKISKILRKKDIGAIGIGAMIVFIAMVLVAGIAASVLIQTSSRLETQAMRSGQETIAEVSTGLSVEEVEGHVDVAGGYVIDLLAIEIKPRSGSKDIDLAQTVVIISDSATQNLLTYLNTPFTLVNHTEGNLFRYADYPDAATSFCVIVLEDGDRSCSSSTPVINQGDHVILAVNASQCFSSLDTRVEVSGEVLVEEGSPGVISFTTPASYGTARVIDLQ